MKFTLLSLDIPRSTVPNRNCVGATAPERNVLALANRLQRASFVRKWTADLFLRSQISRPYPNSLSHQRRSRPNQIANKDAPGRI